MSPVKLVLPTPAEVKATVDRYAAGVLSGEIVAGKLVKLAVERHLRDLKEGPARGLRFNATRAWKAVAFCAFVSHSKGKKFAGKPFVPEPWEALILWALFGWEKLNEDGKWVRRFNTAYVEVARKNGKSTLAAVIALLLLDADEEPGAEVYTTATKSKQARIVFDEASRMVKKSPALKVRIKPFKNVMKVERLGAKMEPLGADSDTEDGLNVHGAIIDEFHAHKNRGMFDMMETATGAREEPLIFIITTAGTDPDTVCGEVRRDTISALDGTWEAAESDSWFGIIYCVDEEDEPLDDEMCWGKANPNLGVSVNRADLARKVSRARQSPQARNSTLRLHFNVWTQQETLAIPMEDWNACSDRVDPEALAGRDCYGALDLSRTGDLTAFVLLFSPKEKGELWKVLPRFWLPEDTINAKVGTDLDKHRLWVEQGFLNECSEQVIDLQAVEAQIVADSKKYNLLAVGYDPWNAEFMRQRLESAGVKMLKFNQRIGDFNEPTKMFLEMVTKHEFAHGGHPVLKNNASNLATHEDANGNLRPVKPKRQTGRRIDGIVSLIMAVGLAKLEEANAFEFRIS